MKDDDDIIYHFKTTPDELLPPLEYDFQPAPDGWYSIDDIYNSIFISEYIKYMNGDDYDPTVLDSNNVAKLNFTPEVLAVIDSINNTYHRK